jgi:hypothetical protein
MNQIDIENKKKEFIDNQIESLVFQASLSRGISVYSPEAVDVRKEEFRKFLSKHIRVFSKRYSDSNFVGVIEEFRDLINCSGFTDILSGESITFGRVQKLLNIYLKYQWVLGNLEKEPQHCPIDSIILREIDWNGKPAWTSPKFGPSEYADAIRQIDEIKQDNESIAVWELFKWSPSESVNKRG